MFAPWQPYKLSNKQSNVSFWQPKSYAFIKQFQQGTAGSLSSAVTAFNSLIDAGTQAAKKMFSDELTEENFLELVTYVVGTNIEKFAINIDAKNEKSPYRYMAECYYKDLETALETLNSDYFKDVHGYISDKLADMQVMHYEINEFVPSEWKE